MSILEEVRQAVQVIPAGGVLTYGDIAKIVGVSPRQVGWAMSRLDDLPWWRVVYADGTIASCHEGEARELLDAESTPMVGARVDLELARSRSAR